MATGTWATAGCSRMMRSSSRPCNRGTLRSSRKRSGGSTAAATNGQTARSGSASATGAQVQNNVDLRSSAAVKVNGNNYNPINIMLNLAASLTNWGVGLASSGDAQSSGGGGGTASSGASNATGLQVLNLEAKAFWIGA